MAGGAAVGHGGSYLLHSVEPTTASWALGGLALLSGIGLLAGFMTPGAAAAVGVSTFAIAAGWISPVAADLVMDWRSATFVAADALALAMLGPGAHSIDAYLFGRREIIVSDDPRRRARP